MRFRGVSALICLPNPATTPARRRQMPPRKSVIFCTITPSDQQAENQKRRCTPSSSPIRNVLRTPRFTSTACIAAIRRLARASETRTPRASLGFPRVQHNQMERQNGASGATLKQRRMRVGGGKRASWQAGPKIMLARHPIKPLLSALTCSVGIDSSQLVLKLALSRSGGVPLDYVAGN